MAGIGAALMLTLMVCAPAIAKIDGITGTTFDLTASSGYITAGDGMPLFVWGYGETGKPMQYPGPTLIVQQGQTITINLSNQLDEPASIVFPGFKVTSTGGAQGAITKEAAPGGSVSYTFVADKPGTYLYQSGSNPNLQIEMGMIGALIVRPTGFDPVNNRIAYDGVEYDYEYLYLFTEMDHHIHELVDQGLKAEVDSTTYFPYYWFINGRTAPDVWAPAGAPWLPNQPYDCMPKVHPNEKMLLRVIGGGRDPHPFHHHGNNGTQVARDGILLSSDGVTADVGLSRFTQTVMPGSTMDVIWDPWIGTDLGWDIHGHAITDDLKDYEIHGESALAAPLAMAGASLTITPADAATMPNNRPFRAVLWTGASLTTDANREIVTLRRDHAVPGGFTILKRAQESTMARDWASGANVTATYHGVGFPVILPDQKDLTLGFMYSGSPFLGAMGALPPGEGGFNVNNGLAFMFHSHNEKEMTNNDIFPGGMMSMCIVEPEGVLIENSPF